MNRINIGDRVKDDVTGLQGIVTGIVDYISGCQQLLVQPPVDNDGKFVSSHWIDEDRLEVVDAGAITITPRAQQVHPGADAPAPVK